MISLQSLLIAFSYHKVWGVSTDLPALLPIRQGGLVFHQFHPVAASRLTIDIWIDKKTMQYGFLPVAKMRL
ncbi:MAG: hypothetical protein WA151_13140 [Desulfatirhabdiaceae bacterium]